MKVKWIGITHIGNNFNMPNLGVVLIDDTFMCAFPPSPVYSAYLSGHVYCIGNNHYSKFEEEFNCKIDITVSEYDANKIQYEYIKSLVDEKNMYVFTFKADGKKSESFYLNYTDILREMEKYLDKNKVKSLEHHEDIIDKALTNHINKELNNL